MELTVALSNPSLGPLLARASAAIQGLSPDLGRHEVVEAELPRRSGEVIAAMVAVLQGESAGLRTVEIRLAAERLMGRSVSASTVKTNLVDSPVFERIGYGRYRLASRD